MVLLGNMENKFLYENIKSQLIKDFLDEDTRKNLIKWIDSKWESLYYDKKNTDEKYRKHLEEQRLRQKGNDYTEKQYTNDHMQVIKIDTPSGKTFLNLGPEVFPKEFWEKAEVDAQKINPNCKFEYISIVKYSSEFGEPTLRPHFDHPTKAVFILDYQLDGNTSWPIVVNLEEFTLKNNECLVFDNNKAIHWRTPQKFKEGESLTMLFYSFIDENKVIPTLEGQAEEIDKYFKHYIDKYNEVFGDSGTQSKVSFQTSRLADLFRWAQQRDKLKNNDL
jgi:hypothetical protein